MSEKEYNNVNTARRAAVSNAWKAERVLVLEGKGTRDWSKSQQAEIVSTGKCKGMFGHHKCSVKDNPSLAGDKNNIQFLDSKEHLDAHNGNYKNDPHGRYNVETGKVSKYGDSIEPEPVINLKNRMADSRMQSSINKFETMKQERAITIKENASKRAKGYERRNVEKNTNGTERSSKALRASRANAKTTPSTSISKTSKALSNGRNSAMSASKSSIGKSGKSAGISSGGRSAFGGLGGKGGMSSGGKGGMGSGGKGGMGSGGKGGMGSGGKGGMSSGGKGGMGSGGKGGMGSGGKGGMGSGGKGGHGGHGK